MDIKLSKKVSIGLIAFGNGESRDCIVLRIFIHVCFQEACPDLEEFSCVDDQRKPTDDDKSEYG